MLTRVAKRELKSILKTLAHSRGTFKCLMANEQTPAARPDEDLIHFVEVVWSEAFGFTIIFSHKHPHVRLRCASEAVVDGVSM